MAGESVAVLDIGKTHTRLLVVDIQAGALRWSAERSSTSVERALPRELDIEGIERWLLAALASAPDKQSIRALVPVAHGAAAVLLSREGAVLTAPDYEGACFESARADYRRLRSPYEQTFSPDLPLGLNLGRQLHYLRTHHPKIMDACAAILPYPQFWAWRLSGVMASEVTSLGCHTDLWQPLAQEFSGLAREQAWAGLFPEIRAAGDALGSISPSIQSTTGLDGRCQVLCGIHDSNASYLCYRASRPTDEPFVVVSSGTWTVIMARGVELSRLCERYDMLANVDALGTPVATARFMGGREYEVITGGHPAARHPSLRSIAALARRDAMALPSFATAGGAFSGHVGRFVNRESLDDEERGALATLYCALQTDLLLDLIGACGPVIVDGPLADNPCFGATLSRLRPESQVLLAESRGGAAQCARILCGETAAPSLRAAAPLGEDLARYRESWRARAKPLLNAPTGTKSSAATSTSWRTAH